MADTAKTAAEEIEENRRLVIANKPDAPPMPVVIIESHTGKFLICRPITGPQDTCRARQHQNRKYRWAMESSVAGSQVNKAPSARTS